jgi:dolichol-phosphate mannosyltransferase
MANEAPEAVRFVRESLERCAGLRNVVFYAVLDRVSRDGTRDLLTEYAREESRLRVIWAPENRCLVDAYVRGYREALAGGHDFILEIDAGFSHQPADIPKFLDAMEGGYDCVFGSRFMPGGSVRNMPVMRRIISLGGSLLTNVLAGTRLDDMTSGFELFSRATLKMVLDRGIQSRAHFFQTEIKFYCRHLRVKEVPITYTTDAASVSAGALSDAFRNLWRIFKLRWKEQ